MSSDSIECSAVAVRDCTRVTSPSHPQQQIDGVHALVHQRAAAVERQRAAPFRFAVVFGRAIPLHTRVDEQNFAERAAVDPLFESANIGLHAILKHHTEFYVRDCFAASIKFVGACRRDIDRLFGQHMKAALRGVDAFCAWSPEGLPIITRSIGRCARNAL